MVSTKRPPRVPIPGVSRAIEQIYDDINEIINAVNRRSDAGGKETEGRTGDIRFRKGDGTNRAVEFRFSDGWFSVPVDQDLRTGATRTESKSLEFTSYVDAQILKATAGLALESWVTTQVASATAKLATEVYVQGEVASAELILQSQINLLDGDVTDAFAAIDLRVKYNDVISAINLSLEAITISSDKINLVGAVTVLSDITGDLGTITAGTITGTTLRTASSGTRVEVLTNGTIHYYGSVYNEELNQHVDKEVAIIEPNVQHYTEGNYLNYLDFRLREEHASVFAFRRGNTLLAPTLLRIEDGPGTGKKSIFFQANGVQITSGRLELGGNPPSATYVGNRGYNDLRYAAIAHNHDSRYVRKDIAIVLPDLEVTGLTRFKGIVSFEDENGGGLSFRPGELWQGENRVWRFRRGGSGPHNPRRVVFTRFDDMTVLALDMEGDRVGIKKINPLATLDVGGDANIDGDTAIGGNATVTGNLTVTGALYADIQLTDVIATGRGHIGATSLLSSTSFCISAPTGDLYPFRVRRGTASRLTFHSNEGLTVGMWGTPPASGLLVSGQIRTNNVFNVSGDSGFTGTRGFYDMTFNQQHSIVIKGGIITSWTILT